MSQYGVLHVFSVLEKVFVSMSTWGLYCTLDNT